MRPAPFGFLFLVLALLLAPSPGFAQRGGSSALALRILGGDTQKPLAGVQVQVRAPGPLTAMTDDSGQVRIEKVPPGVHMVEIRRIGYRTHQMMVGFIADQPVEGDVELAPQPVEVAALEARGRSVEATARRSQGSRVDLFTRDEILERASTRHNVGELIQGKFPGVRAFEIHTSTSGPKLCITMNRAYRRSFCSMVSVYVDGTRIYDPGDYLLNLHLDSLESIELLGPIEAGGRYGTDAGNGVLEIYTHGNGPYAHH
ncbi:MAG: carboxypeptidase regulatory-like domain-containing protein [Gemmatimonadetes bacterium]|nr:carboxypeptidase regulatory-like domain-containing protein [Gemmatimonadota bacterium]